MIYTVLAMSVGLGIIGATFLWVRTGDADRIDGLQHQVEQLAADNKALRDQQGENQRASECRSRAAALLDQAESAAGTASELRDAAFVNALISFVAANRGVPIPEGERPGANLPGLNGEALARAKDTQRVAELRVQSVAECGRNPDFIPQLGTR